MPDEMEQNVGSSKVIEEWTACEHQDQSLSDNIIVMFYKVEQRVEECSAVLWVVSLGTGECIVGKHLSMTGVLIDVIGCKKFDAFYPG